MTIAENALNKSLYIWRILFDESKMKYTDVSEGNFWYCKKSDLLDFLEIKANDLLDMKKNWKIPKYKWICYRSWWQKWYYNLFREETVITKGDKPFITNEIKFLISNICNNDPEAIDWVYKAILYKYQNLNAVIIPAVVFHWIQWTGKWLFIEFLSRIFWKDNTQLWITQEMLDSRFIPYQWKKLIVEMNEIYVEDNKTGKKVMNKLKALINEKTVMVEKKWVDSMVIDSIAWFIMSSNEKIPIRLDGGWENGDRRFTIIETGRYIPLEEWTDIVNSFTDENISWFITWLEEKYWKIDKKDIKALDNESKRNLTEAMQTVGTWFFKWFEEKYPHIKYLTNSERDILLWKYRDDIWDRWDDRSYSITFFNRWLWFRYKKVNKRLKWDDVKIRWYEIQKEVEGKWYWEHSEFDKKFGPPAAILKPNS